MTESSSGLERAALVAEIFGGIAVVLSVIYLALQIADNNRILNSQSHYNALALMQRPVELMLESESLSNAMYQCNRAPYEVEQSVWPRCSHYYFIAANGWEYAYYQNLDEAIPPELWVGSNRYWANQAATVPGWVRFWEEVSIGFGEPFRSHVEKSIQQNLSRVGKK
jgi:hypothetical protein